MLTIDQLSSMIPSNKEPEKWLPHLEELLPKYNINTRNRVAGFISQCAHESRDFTTFHENMNYTWKALRRVFSRYFPTDAEAQKYHRKPQEIANIVYDDANRINKLGNTEPGDGWRFRGRGLIQLTGRYNFERFGRSIGKTAEEAVEYASTERGAIETACWFWNEHNLNRFADNDDIRGMSRAINGGTHGLKDRTTRYENAKRILSDFTTPSSNSTSKNVSSSISFTPLKRGNRNENVRKIQKALRIGEDGIFGRVTEASVKSWQRRNRFPPNGVVSERQFNQLTK